MDAELVWQQTIPLGEQRLIRRPDGTAQYTLTEPDGHLRTVMEIPASVVPRWLAAIDRLKATHATD